MSWFLKILPSRIRTEATTRGAIPSGLWSKCPSCKSFLLSIEFERNMAVCPKCNHHLPLNSKKRLHGFLDSGELIEIGKSLASVDRLNFKDIISYRERLVKAQKLSNEKEAITVVAGKLKGRPLVVATFNFDFMAGSIGSAVGERFVRGINYAIEQQIPLVVFCASGGARMQESVFSLYQFAKIPAALAALANSGVPYISVMTNPTLGGGSLNAMLGDINIAEPGALIGFAGPRVIEQTVRETLPEGFQRSEFLLDHGGLDMIIDRREMRSTIASLLSLLASEVTKRSGKRG